MFKIIPLKPFLILILFRIEIY